MKTASMQNGYTPKEFAYSVAIDQLHYAMKALALGHYDTQLTPAEQKEVILNMTALRFKLAEMAKLDII